MRPEVKERIDREIREHPITIYMKGTEMFPRCGFSAATVEALRRAGAQGSIHSIDVLADPEIRESIKEYSDWPTIPQVYIGGEFIGGCDITRELYETGELRSRIEKASVAFRWRRSSRSARKASTTPGSNCRPFSAARTETAFERPRALRYGRFVVIVS